MYKNLHVLADSNVKNINFDLQIKVSQRITRNGSNVYIYRLSKNRSGTKICLGIGRKAAGYYPDDYQKFKYHRYGQKSYAPINTHMGTIRNLFKKKI